MKASTALDADLRAVLHTQHHLIQTLTADLDGLDHALADGVDQTHAIADLARRLQGITDDVAWLEADDLTGFDPDAILRLAAERASKVDQARVRLGTHPWPAYVRHCQASLLTHAVDPLSPYEALLTLSDMQRLRDEAYEAQVRWDNWDYILVGVSGMLAALTDVLLVGTPQTSPLTVWLKRYHGATADDWFGRWTRACEVACKVPYDAQAALDGTRVPGMTARSHRLQSLGHDPVLGFVFGVLDILRGTVTGFSYEHMRGQHQFVILPSAGVGQEVNLIAALLRHLAHLVTDVTTPMGLPPPLLGLFQGINAGHFGSKGRTVGQIARWMYLNGYDLRHFLVGGLSPAVIEIVLRAGVMLRCYAEHGEMTLDLAQHPKYRTMLLAAHGIAALANGGKVVLMQGNPLAINLAQWYALIGYMLPSVRFWLFDAQRLRLEHLAQITTPDWEQLVHQSAALLTRVAAQEAYVVTLGEATVGGGDRGDTHLDPWPGEALP
ncbi:hypothetical protein EYB53_022105 [Candidatus Chloroploca sp. M-50]|uniref:Uncharacterized protein n=1 Tax=Candidatus Chloroploca mongolica TaxID=2528176 RepID=A0ABS4DG61_9CHLR|nr:hypothetical protein [Candidatus Chloroploca mongolica]MBP1468422.1 hypothetical protein [Candidatus Chloroploca mongolica]